MKGNLCITAAKTNEEYREVIKKRMRMLAGIVALGVLTAFIGFFAEFYLEVSFNSHMLGVYTGFGSGLAAACGYLWVKNKLLLGNEEKLKQSRISNSDERLIEINNRSLRMAGWILLAGIYVTGLIGGIFDPIFIKILLILVCLYVFTYAGAYFYYTKKM